MLSNWSGLEWIDSAGGPLILLEAAHLADWRGIDGGVADSSHPESDYDRACAIDDYLGLVSVGPTQALILGDEPLATVWYPTAADTGLLIRWAYGDTAVSVIPILAKIPSGVWKPTGIHLRVGNTPLYLFDSAVPGDEIDEYLTIVLTAGLYQIDTQIVRPDPQTEFWVHGLSKA